METTPGELYDGGGEHVFDDLAKTPPKVTDNRITHATEIYHAIKSSEGAQEVMEFDEMPSRHKALLSLVESSEDQSGYPAPEKTASPRISPIGLEINGVRYPFTEQQARANHRLLLENIENRAKTQEEIAELLDATQAPLNKKIMEVMTAQAKEKAYEDCRNKEKAAREEIAKKYHPELYSEFALNAVAEAMPDIPADQIKALTQDLLDVKSEYDRSYSLKEEEARQWVHYYNHVDHLHDYYEALGKDESDIDTNWFTFDVFKSSNSTSRKGDKQTADDSNDTGEVDRVAAEQDTILGLIGLSESYISKNSIKLSERDASIKLYIADNDERIRRSFPNYDEEKLFETIRFLSQEEIRRQTFDESRYVSTHMASLVAKRRLENGLERIKERYNREVPGKLITTTLSRRNFIRQTLQNMVKKGDISESDAEEYANYLSSCNEMYKKVGSMVKVESPNTIGKVQQAFRKITRQYEYALCDFVIGGFEKARRIKTKTPTYKYENPIQIIMALQEQKRRLMGDKTLDLPYSPVQLDTKALDILRTNGVGEKEAQDLVSDFRARAMTHYLYTIPRIRDKYHYYRLSGRGKTNMSEDDGRRLDEYISNLEKEYNRTVTKDMTKQIEQEFAKMQSDFAKQLYGEDAKRVYFFPTGNVVSFLDGSISADIKSPMSADILEAMPAQLKKCWGDYWVARMTSKGDEGQLATVQAVNNTVDNIHATYQTESEKAREKGLADFRLSAPELLKPNGEFSATLDSSDYAKLEEIAPLLGDFIGEVKLDNAPIIISKEKISGLIKTFIFDGHHIAPWIISGDGGRYTLNLGYLRESENEEAISMLGTVIGAKLYQEYESEFGDYFMDTLGKRANISALSVQRLCGKRVDSLATRRKIAARAYFIAYFNRYVTGRTNDIPPESRDAMSLILGFIKASAAKE